MKCINQELSQFYNIYGTYDIYKFCCKHNQDLCPFECQCKDGIYRYINLEDNNLDNEEYN